MMQLNTVEVYKALSELARRYQFRNRDEVCCYGLTVSQCYALEFLADHEPSAMSALSAQLGLDLSSTTRLVDQLVKKKLVTRERNGDDARVREIRVTDAGKRLVARVQQDLVGLLDGALDGMPETLLRNLPEAL